MKRGMRAGNEDTSASIEADSDLCWPKRGPHFLGPGGLGQPVQGLPCERLVLVIERCTVQPKMVRLGRKSLPLWRNVPEIYSWCVYSCCSVPWKIALRRFDLFVSQLFFSSINCRFFFDKHLECARSFSRRDDKYSVRNGDFRKKIGDRRLWICIPDSTRYKSDFQTFRFLSFRSAPLWFCFYFSQKFSENKIVTLDVILTPGYINVYDLFVR